MNTRVLLLGCLLAMSSQAQDSKRELWTWKDASGVTQYSDRPVPGAKRVELIGVTSSSAPTVAAPAKPAATSPAKTAAAAPVEYRSLEIWQPENGATFYGADATVSVRMRSEPEVASGHRLTLYLDGKLVEGPPTSLEYTLSNLERGVHSITAVITDEKGAERIRSEPRVFHIRQPSTLEPRAVGPNLKPPPKK